MSSSVSSTPLTPTPVTGTTTTTTHPPVPPGTTSWSLPSGVDLKNAWSGFASVESRLSGMVQSAVAREGGIRALSDPQKVLTPAKSEKKQFSAVNEAAKKANAAMARLDTHPASDFRSPGPGSSRAEKKAYEATMKDLQKAVETQYALGKALTAYGKSASGKAALCFELSQNCDRRVGEMLNFAGHAATGDAHVAPGDNFSTADNALAVTMHGHGHALTQLHQQASDLFDELRQLESQQVGLNAADVQSKAQELGRRIDALKVQMEQVLSPPTVTAESLPETGVSSPRLLYEQDLFETFSSSLTLAKDRVNTLAKGESRPMMLHAAEQLFHLSSLESLDGKPIRLTGSLHDRLGVLYSQEKQLMAKITNAVANNTLDRAGVVRFKQEQRLLHNAFIEFHRDMVRDVHSGKISERDAMTVLNAMRMTAGGSIGHPLFESGLDELAAMVQRSQQPTRPFQTGQFMALAFEHPISVGSLVECHLRDISPEYVELQADPKALTTHRTLGSGAANSVTLCVYKDAQGQDVQLVFKPEYDARFGFQALFASRTGQDIHTGVLQRNMASSDVARALGCESVVAQSKAGSFNGAFGLFMSRAPGKTAHQHMQGREFSHTMHQLESKGLKEVAVANLQRELCNLEWADLLSGQTDRHSDNYLVDINPETGAVRVTGIDNDASFGTAMVGAGKIDLSKLTPAPTLSPGRSPIVNFKDRPTERDVTTMWSTIGLNQMSVPQFIDRHTYTALMAIDRDAYAATLRRNLDEPAVQAALSRLDSAKELALELHHSGKVVDTWGSSQVNQGYARTAGNFTAMRFARSSKVLLPFFLRDFAPMLG